MKTKAFFSILLAAALTTALTNCSGDKKDTSAQPQAEHEGHDHDQEASQEDAPEPAGEPQFEVDVAFQRQLADVFTAYVALKDALVASDPAQAKEAAASVSGALSKVDIKLLSGAANHDWATYHGPIITTATTIASTTDLDTQRKAFRVLSDNLYKSIKAFGLGGQEAFYEFCPMAFNNEGAYWLSSEDKIRNPYFGDKMLTCGNVEERLK